MDKREEIKLALMSINYIKDGELHINLDLIADFILEDRKRVVNPLVKLRIKHPELGFERDEAQLIALGINETLKNALD